MLLPLLSFLFLIPLSTSLSCLPCCTEQDLLTTTMGCTTCYPQSPSECRSGQLTKDVCGCCDVCAQAAGEVCGGPWGISGTCAEDLYCDISSRGTTPPYGHFGYEGICRPTDYKDDFCCERKIVKETRDVYILDRNTGRKALDICLDSCVYRKEGGGRGDLFCFQSGNMQVDCK